MGEWTNYLTVLASRMVTVPNGDKHRVSRTLATYGLRPGDVVGDVLARILASPPPMRDDETSRVVAWRITREMPSWVECIGRNMTREGCTNCGRRRCGLRDGQYPTLEG